MSHKSHSVDTPLLSPAPLLPPPRAAAGCPHPPPSAVLDPAATSCGGLDPAPQHLDPAATSCGGRQIAASVATMVRTMDDSELLDGVVNYSSLSDEVLSI